MKLYNIYYNSSFDQWMLFIKISLRETKAFFYLPYSKTKVPDHEDEKRFYLDDQLRGNDDNYWDKRLEEKYSSKFAQLLISQTFTNPQTWYSNI